ncbi:MAG: L,D-transpeptidase [Chloroflexota bacterium]|jgi:lipoprotein-anchoring transpeptidase ErfK/SrfK
MESAAQRDSSTLNQGRGWTVVLSAALAILGATTVIVLAAQIAAMMPSFQVNVEEASVELSPAVPVNVSVSRLGVSVIDVTLIEKNRDIDGKVLSERVVPVELAPIEGPLLSYWSEYQLTNPDSSNPLAYDNYYDLRLTVSVREPAFPLPKEVLITREYPFQTLTTPQLRAPEGVVELGYQKPLRLEWNSPIRQFEVEIEPPVEVNSWIDQELQQVGYVNLIKEEPGKQYTIRVVNAQGANGAPLIVSPKVTVETAAHPAPIQDSVYVENGDRVVVRWDRPVKSLDYEITPFIGSSLTIDPKDPMISLVQLHNPPQQQEYRITFTGGTGTSGAPIEGPHEITVNTPPPLSIQEFRPVEGTFGVALQEPISITFAEEILDRKSAEAALSIEPQVPGYFEWPEPNKLRFVPQERYPEMTEINVTVKAGRNGPRSLAGGYLEEPIEFTFLTRPNKLIDVDLTKQQLTLLQGDEPVFTTLVATGVRGAETPVGEYIIHYKAPFLRMRGVNPDGSRYDIPNVPWVMAFLGDYTIHAAPWRWQFGYPQSNGCVGMTTADAKYVYDWTPIGTPVRIHY